MSEGCNSCRTLIKCYFCRPDTYMLGCEEENGDEEKMQYAMRNEDYICMLCREKQEELIERRVFAFDENDRLLRSLEHYENQKGRKEQNFKYSKLTGVYYAAHARFEEIMKDLFFLKELPPDLEAFADVTFVFDSKQTGDSEVGASRVCLPAHRFILAGKSDVFRAMFTSPMTEQQTGEILVKDTSFPVLQALVRYCYSADIRFSAEVLPMEVFMQAHKYQLRDLQDICETELLTTFTKDNLFERLMFSRTYGTKRLELSALKFFKSHFKNVSVKLLDDIYGSSSTNVKPDA